MGARRPLTDGSYGAVKAMAQLKAASHAAPERDSAAIANAQVSDIRVSRVGEATRGMGGVFVVRSAAAQTHKRRTGSQRAVALGNAR